MTGGGGGEEKNSAPSLALTVLVSARTEIRVDLHYLWGVQGSIYNGMRVFLAWGGGRKGGDITFFQPELKQILRNYTIIKQEIF